LSLEFKPVNMSKLMEVYSVAPVVKAHKMALRDTGKNVLTELSKQVRAEYNVNAATVKSKTFLRADNKESGRVSLGFRDYRPNLGRFGTSQAKTGWRVSVRKGGGSSLVKGSFKIARISHELIWARLTAEEKASSKYKKRKSGIKVLRTISVPEMAGAVANNGKLDALMQTQYAKRFNHHFMRAIGLRP